MQTVTSKDGTVIAYDKKGSGPALIIVLGALSTRNFGSVNELIDLLASHFTVYSYDRRGRGDSGNTLPYAAEREVEDLEAVIDAAGEAAYVYSHSSGGGLALRAADQLGAKIKKLAMYEVPYNVDEEAVRVWQAYGKQLEAAKSGGEAVDAFMKLVGMPDEQVAEMHHSPIWGYMESVGPSLRYDFAVMGDTAVIPEAMVSRVECPVLVMCGGDSYPFMRQVADKLGTLLPTATVQVLDGQKHDVDQKVVTPVIRDFFLM